MSSPDDDLGSDEEFLEDVAARWVVRKDRRLSSAESSELEAWLEADPRHRAAFEQALKSWQFFRKLGGAVRQPPAPPIVRMPRHNWAAIASMAAAAALALAITYFYRGNLTGDSRITATASSGPNAAETRTLGDGSIARLRGDADVIERFSRTERRVRLLRGEAFFSVVKESARPFLVEIGDVTVRAVGTAFVVRAHAREIDVWVTEGTVQVSPGTGATPLKSEDAPHTATVGAGHRAIVSIVNSAPAAVIVTQVSADEMARTLAWNSSMLDLGGATLGELIKQFPRRTGQRIEIQDADLADVQIGGRFPTDDLEGFLRALEQVYEVRSERLPDGRILLRKAR